MGDGLVSGPVGFAADGAGAADGCCGTGSLIAGAFSLATAGGVLSLCPLTQRTEAAIPARKTTTNAITQNRVECVSSTSSNDLEKMADSVGSSSSISSLLDESGRCSS